MRRYPPVAPLSLIALLVFASASACNHRLENGVAGTRRGTRPDRAVATPAPIVGGAPACPASDAGTGRDPSAPTLFAVIGDFGQAGPTEQKIAELVHGWRPDFVITTGDNNYPLGAAETIDANIGQYFHDFIAPYRGRYGCSSVANRFFPSLGNHDWYTPGAKPYLDYFALPGHERYYDVVWRDVHLFAIDSDGNEPDGNTADSVQAMWLKGRLAASTARWQIVYMHHPPYSSGPHGSSTELRWPYAAWGADLVLAGHDHTYERLQIDGIPYIVNGVGGSTVYALGTRVEGSVAGYDAGYGAMTIEADAQRLITRFYTGDGVLIDEHTVASAR